MTTETALLLSILLPFAAGCVVLIIPRRAGWLIRDIALLTAAAAAVAAVRLFREGEFAWGPHWAGGEPVFGLDGLGAFVLLGIAFFSLIITLYSIGFLKDKDVSPPGYYASFLWVIGAAFAAVLARNMMVLVFFWALMGLPFYLLINMGTGAASDAAKKTLIVLGGSDCLLIFGVAVLYGLSGSLDILQPASDVSGLGLIACLCFAAAAFAKAGALPLHSWLPDSADTAPVPVVALLPASLDKLLGIYLFARISLGLFEVGGILQDFFILIGAATVLCAVMMALVQHRLRRLLGFHAVSQVGYMIIGIASGSPIGIAGGLFHMLNNALYKSCLFMTGGAAERHCGTGDLDEMGGLARRMPVTFGSALVCAMAISGIPPLNGFVSKLMVYYGLVELGGNGGAVWIVALAAAMIGSALTLASFIKMLHSAFLGAPSVERKDAGPLPNGWMGVPIIIIATLCVGFGVFAYVVPLPVIAGALPVAVREGLPDMALLPWQPLAATFLLCLALFCGIVVYYLGSVGRVRIDEVYIGGEVGDRASAYRFGGPEFYKTITLLPSLKKLYADAQRGWYDIYELGYRFTAWVTLPLCRAHSGLLLTYAAWCVLGLVVLLWLLL